MDFGSIVESLSSGPFNWATGSVSSACAHNCFDKNHYHRHCGCALHSIDTGFKGSPACSPPYTVKVSGTGNSKGRIYRSISVQNLGDKKFQSGNVSCDAYSYSKDVSLTFSPSSFSSSVSSLSQLGMGRDDLPSMETLALVEDLASFISMIKDEDAGSNNTELHDHEIERDSSGGAADEDCGAQALLTFSPENQPSRVSNLIASSRASLHGPLRLSLLEIVSVTSSIGPDSTVKARCLPGHRKMKSHGW